MMGLHDRTRLDRQTSCNREAEARRDTSGCSKEVVSYLQEIVKWSCAIDLETIYAQPFFSSERLQDRDWLPAWPRS